VGLEITELRGREYRQGQAHGLTGQAIAQPKPPNLIGGDIKIPKGMWPPDWKAGFREIHQE
jgi:hypothetical protein